jgi:hypothetical protein
MEGVFSLDLQSCLDNIERESHYIILPSQGKPPRKGILQLVVQTCLCDTRCCYTQQNSAAIGVLGDIELANHQTVVVEPNAINSRLL